jgi:hypothetical protein
VLGDDLKVDVESARSVLVYRDASLPTIFYYSSTRPAVARSGAEYQLTLVHYDKPINGNAGMLSLVVNLQPDDTEMANVRRELQERNAGQTLEFRPIPWTSGTVATALVGGSPVFSTPSLLGENSAVLSIGLTVDQYLMLREKGKNPASSPISIVYGLSYEAFRAKFGFSVQFDESKLRDWVQEKCSANLLFISVEKVETFEELRQNGVIRVVSENQTGEEPPDGFREAFLRSLKSILVPLPRFAPAPEAGGGNWLIGFDCSTVHDVQNISKRLDTNMQVSGVVARKAFIQGAIAGLNEALAARPDVELSTGVSFTRTLTVRCHDAFDGRPLDAVTVAIRSSTANRGAHEFKDSRTGWPVTLVHPPGIESGYSYTSTLYFRDRDAKPTPAVDIRRDQSYLDIIPSEIYTYRRYAASVADEFPWNLVKTIGLVLRGPDPLEYQPGQLTLKADTPAGSIEAFAPSRVDLDAVSVSATYTPVAGGGAPFELVGLPAGTSIFLNPFTRRVVTFRVAPDFDWNSITQISITITASADSPQLWVTRRFLLSPDTPQIKVAYWYPIDKQISYYAVFRKNGKETKTGQVNTRQAEVIISASEAIASKESKS